MRYKSIKAAKIWILLRLSWRLKPSVRPETIRRFASIEADSSWQLLQAYQNTRCPDTKADLLQQAIEERHHASLFRQVFDDLVDYPTPLRHEPRKSIVPSPFWKFFAYCFVGEKDAAERFLLLYKNLPTSPLRRVLKQILRDEAGHVETAMGLAKRLNVSIDEFKTEVQKVKNRRLKESWMRSGRKVTHALSLVWLGCCYGVIAPVCIFHARRKLHGKAPQTKSYHRRKEPQWSH